MKLSPSLIYISIVLAYDIFINATTTQQIVVYSILVVICFLVPHIWKSGGYKKCFSFANHVLAPPIFKLKDFSI